MRSSPVDDTYFLTHCLVFHLQCIQIFLACWKFYLCKKYILDVPFVRFVKLFISRTSKQLFFSCVILRHPLLPQPILLAIIAQLSRVGVGEGEKRVNREGALIAQFLVIGSGFFKGPQRDCTWRIFYASVCSAVSDYKSIMLLLNASPLIIIRKIGKRPVDDTKGEEPR